MIAAVALVLLLIIYSNELTQVQSQGVDCYDSCSTGCVNRDSKCLRLITLPISVFHTRTKFIFAVIDRFMTKFYESEDLSCQFGGRKFAVAVDLFILQLGSLFVCY